jgi:ABC-2 type transport system permease protein
MRYLSKLLKAAQGKLMNKIWMIAKHEYLRHVLRKRFLFVLLSLPLFILFIAGFGVVVGLMEVERATVGVIDLNGYLSIESTQYISENQHKNIFEETSLLFLNDVSQAETMLQQGELTAYYVIPEGYPAAAQVQLFSNGEPSRNVLTALDELFDQRLLRNVSGDLKARILNDPDIVIKSIDTDRQQSTSEWYMIMIPVLSGVLFVVVVNTSGGYLLRAVVEEKENRTMEIMLTSVSSNQLMSGKIFGNLSVGLTQLIIWFGLPLMIYFLVSPVLMQSFNISIAPQFVWLTLLTLFPAFILVAALMAGLGATVTETQEAQQISSLFTLPIVAPYWFMSLIMTNPNSAFCVGLSLFPLTAPVTLPLRAVFTDIPLWQSCASIGILILSAYFAVRFAGHIFRVGMLRYGKRLSFKEVFRALRQKEAA